MAFRYEPPIVPEVRSEGDTSNFDRYPDSIEEQSGPVVDAATSEKLFKDF